MLSYGLRGRPGGCFSLTSSHYIIMLEMVMLSGGSLSADVRHGARSLPDNFGNYAIFAQLDQTPTRVGTTRNI